MFCNMGWVRVLRSIRKHGAYITKEEAIELFCLIDSDDAEALRKVNNPRGETKLYYDVVSKYYKQLSPCSNHTRLRGEPDNTFGRLDSKAKGTS